MDEELLSIEPSTPQNKDTIEEFLEKEEVEEEPELKSLIGRIYEKSIGSGLRNITVQIYEGW